MHLNSKVTKLMGIFGSPVLLLIIFYTILHTNKDDNKKILRMHCNTINSDFTRPDRRMCVSGIKLEKDLFYFKTKENKVEVYEIIKDKSIDGKGEKYLYVYQTTTTQ